MNKQQLKKSPFISVGIAVAIVLGINASPFQATSAFLNSRQRTSPVSLYFIGPSDPPAQRQPI